MSWIRSFFFRNSGPGGIGATSSPSVNGAESKPKNGPESALAFFQNRSISLVDMYTDQGEPSEKCGEINFSLDYDFFAKDLAAKDANGLSDPYVRVTLLPDKKHRLETKIKRRTLNPRWNETFYFEGFPINKLQSRVLHLHVYDYDRFSRDDSIGEVHLPLCQVDFTAKPAYWKPLYPPIKEKLGELLAKNLKAKDINGKSDPYVKVWLMFGDKRVEKKKTPIYKCNLNPIFNATFEFDVPWEQIRDCALDVQVMDFDTVGRNELIGKLCLGSKNGSGPTETKQWQDMIAKTTPSCCRVAQA
ncbi:SYT7 [Lepeophtheirus salmonis]|uniref:SYT7 n=1 Tax=Lepeophtheirus salmonis TaxID=72036 RepID=A0A7R8CW95_LEPSM|nr:SYT7 [Lepeophtheirus salmonis]CAF2950252.1 SYT7 [Lepeophtheirus salmonis]